MAIEKGMTINEQWKYLKTMQKRYQKTSRGKKGKWLDEMEAVTGQHWKSLIRLMAGNPEQQPRRRERKRFYVTAVGRR